MKYLFILGGGGHTTEMISLINDLNGSFEYVIDKKDNLSKAKINTPGKVYRSKNLRKMLDTSVFSMILNIVPAFVSAFSVLLRSKSNVIVSSGPAIAIPYIVIGKLLFRKKVFFIETISRVYSGSKTGKIVLPFSDLFFIQWKELKRIYPRAVYAGRLL